MPAATTRLGSVTLVAALLACVAVTSPAVYGAAPVRLKYVGHLLDTDLGARHLMGVETIFGHYALASSGDALCLFDLDTALPATTGACLDVIPQLDSTTTVTRPDGIAYVNLRQAGFAVVRIDPGTLDLTLLGTVSEAGVFFEKMTVVGDRLYVAAHAHGLRIYDLTQPAAPSLIGQLTTGFDDAFAIAVHGATAYVADGAGGLKIVDVSDESAPAITTGETTLTAMGTAEDVIVHDGHVYVASGGAGIAVYDLGDIQSRALYDTPGCAKHLALVGEHLAVADIRGLEVFAIEPDGSLTRAAGESSTFREDAGGVSTRMWHGVSAWGTDRIVVADWDTLDIYELVDPGIDVQADVSASSQRLRFSPTGGSATVRLTSEGSGELVVSAIESTETSFTVQPANAVLQPGESLELQIDYAGGLPGEGLILVHSNDPDESPLPIQVFGDTPFLDPGEPATPFALQAWTLDHATQRFMYSTFDLQSHVGKVIYLHVFSTW